jgi:hypothetical protein
VSADPVAVYAPTAAEQRDGIPELADSLHAQLYELHRAPTPEKAERATAGLAAAQRAVARYRETLQIEGQPA